MYNINAPVVYCIITIVTCFMYSETKTLALVFHVLNYGHVILC